MKRKAELDAGVDLYSVDADEQYVANVKKARQEASTKFKSDPKVVKFNEQIAVVEAKREVRASV